MKLTKRFEELLKEHFTEVIVIDERGDGHFIEMVMIDEVFTDMKRVDKSRYIFKILGDFTKQVHAFSVKGFTSSEWEKKKENFTPVKYVHLRR